MRTYLKSSLMRCRSWVLLLSESSRANSYSMEEVQNEGKDRRMMTVVQSCNKTR